MAHDFQSDDIVCVLIKGQPLIGRLVSFKGNKAVLMFGGHRRDQEVPHRDLVPCGQLSNSRHRAALPTPEQVQTIVLSSRICAEAWWLLVSDASDDEVLPTLSLADLTDLLVGQPDLTALAAVWSWVTVLRPGFVCDGIAPCRHAPCGDSPATAATSARLQQELTIAAGLTAHLSRDATTAWLWIRSGQPP